MKHVEDANINFDDQNFRETVATDENCILRKMGLQCQIPDFKILFKIVFCGAGCSSKHDNLGKW